MNDSIKRIIDIADKMLIGRLSLVEGAREMAGFEDYFAQLNSVEYEDYEVFIDIKFDTDSLPITEAERKNWSLDALKLKDIEIKKIELDLMDVAFIRTTEQMKPKDAKSLREEFQYGTEREYQDTKEFSVLVDICKKLIDETRRIIE